MKSRITIELSEDNQPEIQIKFEHSDDVRDTLIKRFLQSFQGSPNAKVMHKLIPTADPYSQSAVVTITPA